jgi:hypothetical protein
MCSFQRMANRQLFSIQRISRITLQSMDLRDAQHQSHFYDESRHNKILSILHTIREYIRVLNTSHLQNITMALRIILNFCPLFLFFITYIAYKVYIRNSLLISINETLINIEIVTLGLYIFILGANV